MENPQANEQPQAPLTHKRPLNNLLTELYNSISVYLRSEDRAKARRAGFALKKRNAEDEMEAKEGAIEKLNELERRGFPEDLAVRVLLILNKRVEGVSLEINLESDGAQNLRLLWEEIERWREAVALYNGNEQQFPYWIIPLEDISLVEDTNEEEPSPSSGTNRQAIEDTGNGAIAQLKAADATKAPSANSNDEPVEPTRSTEDGQYIFRQSRGGIWELRFENESAQMPDSKGLQRIWKLLQSDPDRGISAAELMGVDIAGNVASLPSDTGGLMIDAKAVSEIKNNMEVLQSEIDDSVNPDRIAELKDQQKRLKRGLLETKGKRNHPRVMQRTPGAKAANAVRKSIDEAMAAIQKAAPGLYSYLQQRIQIGTTCRFFIDPGKNWLTDTAPNENILQK